MNGLTGIKRFDIKFFSLVEFNQMLSYEHQFFKHPYQVYTQCASNK